MTKTDPKAIKRRIRELRAHLGQPGARAAIQRLIGELTRAKQAQDVADMQGPANRRTAHRQNSDHPRDPDLPRRLDEPITGRETKEPIMWVNDDVSGWPSELRRRRWIWRP
ncbi:MULTISPECIES: hypothetical protein [unclassified Streptomyces]|jgi:hypothetical protein|uniref:hypothetical protein n=1 Tax=unclassified Streptomyces TaxID=2593676 RepID=UPI00034E71DF|nr:hypothetical protein [Streptomyces sp. HGB0020]EPD65602.1 hypothetical protein HMPREF1211_02157 [Streptomyces sp. HGB0020]